MGHFADISDRDGLENGNDQGGCMSYIKDFVIEDMNRMRDDNRDHEKAVGYQIQPCDPLVYVGRAEGEGWSYEWVNPVLISKWSTEGAP